MILLYLTVVVLGLATVDSHPAHPGATNSKSSVFETSDVTFLPGKCASAAREIRRFSELDTQTTLGIPFVGQSAPKPKTPSPPLEILPLIVSGPSDNRVDLVFFSDGCE